MASCSSPSSVEVAMGFQRCVQRTFHDVPYKLSVSGDSNGLCIEAEHSEEGQRWSAKFAAAFIEEITHRTGNAKTFDVFVTMLLSALAQESDSVYLDVLTARDLEMLRRHANPQGPPMTSNSGHSDKRYLILTYRVEFDKVHYPLPLPLEVRSEVDTLRAQLAHARAELRAARSDSANAAGPTSTSPSSGGVGVGGGGGGGGGYGPSAAMREQDRTALLQRQNSELADALRAQRTECESLRQEVRATAAAAAAAASAPTPSQARRPPSVASRDGRSSATQSSLANDLEIQKYREKIKTLQADLKSMQDQVRDRDSRHKKELDRINRELKSERQKAQKLEQQVGRLQQQLSRTEEERRNAARAASRAPSADRARSRTPSADRSRPPSRPMSRPPSNGPRPSGVQVPAGSRQASRASSVASSRERTPSPSYFIRNSSGGPGGPTPPRRSPSSERPQAMRRSSSPGTIREGMRNGSPGAASRNVSPYKQPVGRLEPNRRGASPGAGMVRRGVSRSGSRERSPSCGATGPLPPLSASSRGPATLRERNSQPSQSPGYMMGPSHSGQGSRPGRPPSATSSRGSGGGGYGGGGYSSSRGNGERWDCRDTPVAPAEPHKPGSLFGLAADLGLSPQAPGGQPSGMRESNRQQQQQQQQPYLDDTDSGPGPGPGSSPAPGPPCAAVAAAARTDGVLNDGNACDIDARLQALQTFLKQTRNVSG